MFFVLWVQTELLSNKTSVPRTLQIFHLFAVAMFQFIYDGLRFTLKTIIVHALVYIMQFFTVIITRGSNIRAKGIVIV